MGSEFYTYEQAAQRLNRSRRAVFGYVKKGFLNKVVGQDKAYLYKEEVDDLAIRLGSDAPAMTRANWFNALGRIQKLEEEMHAAKFALDMRILPPLRLKPVEADGLYRATTSYITAVDRDGQLGAPSFVWDNWFEILESMDEESLTLIADATGDRGCWKIFLQLGQVLIDFCVAKDREAPSILWQSRLLKISKIRKSLRGVVLLWLESGKGTISYSSVLDAFDTKKESVVKRVVANSHP